MNNNINEKNKNVHLKNFRSKRQESYFFAKKQRILVRSEYFSFKEKRIFMRHFF